MMAEGKRTAGWSRNSFIRQLKKYADIGSYRIFKEMEKDCLKWRRGVTNQQVEYAKRRS